MRSAVCDRAWHWKRAAAACALWLSLLLAAACGGAPAPVVLNNKATPVGRNSSRASTLATNGGRGAQSFTLLDNSRAQLSDYQGQVVVLDFWATYCPPCREEAPHLNALQQRFGEKGLRVIGLNVGGPDDRPKIAEFVGQFGLKYSFGFPDPEMINLYMGSDDRIPQTIVFNRSGRILKHFVGYDPEVSADLERTIEKALTSQE